MLRSSRFLVSLTALVFLTRISFALEWKPIGRVSALGGQYFTPSTHSNGANVDASFAPVMALSPRLSLIPIYLGAYHETQSVYSFLGENTLINRELNQTIVLRSVWAMNESYRLKPRIGHKWEWTQQTSDQGLFDGLFNYRRIFMGLGLERTLPAGSIEVSGEYSLIRYPNYQAAESNPALTATGITQAVGTDVLNYNATEAAVLYTLASEDHTQSFSANLAWVRQAFRDQKIIGVDTSGFESVGTDQRVDNIYVLTLQQSLRPGDRWALRANEIAQYYTSNQNAYDAAQFGITDPFTPKHYNFVDVQLNPQLSLFWLGDQRLETALGATYGYRKYAHRRTQNGFGVAEDRLIWSMNWGANLLFRYRLRPNLYAVVTGSLLRYTSNTRYEVNYPYNYTVANYLAGLSFEF